jgi:hypothetical protein
MPETTAEDIPEEIREAFEYTPVYCTACEAPVAVTVKDDPEPLTWECSCAVGYPTSELPEQWIRPDTGGEL